MVDPFLTFYQSCSEPRSDFFCGIATNWFQRSMPVVTFDDDHTIICYRRRFGRMLRLAELEMEASTASSPGYLYHTCREIIEVLM